MPCSLGVYSRPYHLDLCKYTLIFTQWQNHLKKHFSEPILIIKWCVAIYNLPTPWHKTRLFQLITFPCGMIGFLHFPKVKRSNVASEKSVLVLPDSRLFLYSFVAIILFSLAALSPLPHPPSLSLCRVKVKQVSWILSLMKVCLMWEKATSWFPNEKTFG